MFNGIAVVLRRLQGGSGVLTKVFKKPLAFLEGFKGFQGPGRLREISEMYQ